MTGPDPSVEQWLDLLDGHREGQARLAALMMTPAGAALFVDLAYRMLLGRGAEVEAIDHAQRDFAAGQSSRRRLVSDIVGSREFREALLVEELLADLRGTRERLDAGAPVGDEQTGERVVEIPWVLSRLRRGEQVLDIGYAHGSDTSLAAMLRILGDGYHGIDLAVLPIPGTRLAGADMCRLPFRRASFDTVTCVSTLEHIGRDNSSYGLAPSAVGSDADQQALTEGARVLRKHGRLLVTVPFGTFEDHGWFVQYDERRWRALVGATPLRTVEEQVFALAPAGWRPAAPADVASCRYGDGVPGARAVLCASLAAV